MPKTKDGKLSVKQTAFCIEYIKDFNATQAAIRAGYSRKGANVQGSQLLSNPNVVRELDRQIDITLGAQREQIKYRVLKELQSIGFNDNERDEIYNKDGELILVSRKDRIKALELLGKYAKLFTDRLEIEAEVHIHTDSDDEKLT